MKTEKGREAWQRASSHLRWDQYFVPTQAEVYVSHWTWEGEYPPHDHDFLEIVLCDSGENQHRSIRGDEPFVPGDVYVLRPGVWHVMTGRRLAAYNCCFGMRLLWHELAWTLEDAALNPLLWSGPLIGGDGILRLHLERTRLDACRSYLQSMLVLGNDRQPRLHARRIGLLTLLLAELAGAIQPPQHEMAKTHPAVLQAMRRLHGELAQPWTMRRLCQEAGLEESYLTRLFREATGLPPMAYLARVRAEKASSLLLSTDRPVAAIGAAVGWDDPNYFARRFRHHYGVSASDYRSQYQQTLPAANRPHT